MTDILYAGFLGMVAGFLPVYLGLVPLPFFQRIRPAWRTILVSFSVGILLFLFADVTMESMELSGAPDSSPVLFLVGLSLGLIGPVLIATRRRRGNAAAPASASGAGSAKMFMAYTISAGIGLHNLGEGLAIGTAYAAGALGLTGLLVIGFFLHNTTEGLGISAPISDMRIRLREPLILGFVAGFPTIVGSMIGSLWYSNALGALFFAAASGALLFVIVELLRLAYVPERARAVYTGVVIGIFIMFITDWALKLVGGP